MVFIKPPVECIFTIVLQIQHENHFLPTSKHWQPKIVAFLVFVRTTASFIAQISSFEKDAILAPVAKQWIGNLRDIHDDNFMT